MYCQLKIERFERIHFWTSYLAWVTTAGSGISGWAIWKLQAGHWVWVAVVGLATVVSGYHALRGIPALIRNEELSRRQLAVLKFEADSYLQRLLPNVPATERPDLDLAAKKFADTRQKYLMEYNKRRTSIPPSAKDEARVIKMFAKWIKVSGYAEYTRTAP